MTGPREEVVQKGAFRSHLRTRARSAKEEHESRGRHPTFCARTIHSQDVSIQERPQ